MPLALLTTIDNHGITNLIAGCLLSNERYESYCWALAQFDNAAKIQPVVVFSDGDTEIERAIQKTWPSTVHLLCRFHIGQNISRALAPILRTRFHQFLDDFWSVSSIEDLQEYNDQFTQLEESWPEASSYLHRLKLKQHKWAFAYTHDNFVAGVSSTQRQEMINSQVKSSLISNSALIRIIDGFDAVEKNTATKLIQASLNTKLDIYPNDPIIKDLLPNVTAFAGALLKEESTLSLSYVCFPGQSSDTYRVSHKDHPLKSRSVEIPNHVFEQAKCSCRKQVWHGIVCRHILCTFRQLNHLSIPIQMIHNFWHKVRDQEQIRSGIITAALRSAPVSSGRAVETSEDIRYCQLTSLCKTLILRSVSNKSFFDLVKSSLTALLDTINKSNDLTIDDDNDDDIIVRNPNKVKTKGRPKTGCKRYISQAEKQRSKRKRLSKS